ncbi:polysaccharide biosynthesis C-terminal domain-containing protein [Butyrivibrio sp. FCS006]|uniref:polysaccharide biosynthesis C-terminal domain-containing protein n=1 Tax=Butyrivibrio sp. FCS006 TaxID=1280684 RepID=UPI0004090295|nr:polysaccharide biosynthesis C-terminal domain-containing protein [Butyrivibrio sp. FCS006]
MKNDIKQTLISNLALQVITALYGLLVPRFLLANYGSMQNGMISSIDQILSYVILLEAGISNAAIPLLFDPIKRKDINMVNEVLGSASRLYLKNGLLYLMLCVCAGSFYSIFMKNQISSLYTFIMFIILSSKSLIDFFIADKYKVLLLADRKLYIYNNIVSVETIVLLIISLWFINANSSLSLVKMLIPLLHLIGSFFLLLIIKREYPHVSLCYNANLIIPQVTGAFIHQICSFLTYNTDIVLMTFLLPNSLLEISVYSVYSLALSMVTRLCKVMIDGMQSVFGKLIADNKDINSHFDLFESLYLPSVFFLFSCYIILASGFSKCFTSTTTDVDYVRPILALLFGINGILASGKDHYVTLINATGEFEKTKMPFILESIINIICTIILIPLLGMNGALIATAISHITALFLIVSNIDHNVVHGVQRHTLYRFFIYSMTLLLIILFERKIQISDSWSNWLIQSLQIFVINLAVYSFSAVLIDRKTIKRGMIAYAKLSDLHR